MKRRNWMGLIIFICAIAIIIFLNSIENKDILYSTTTIMLTLLMFEYILALNKLEKKK